MRAHYQIIIIGAGTGGIMAASHLLKKKITEDIAIIDPAHLHYYQPAWTLVGAGAYDFKKTEKPMRELIPAGADWIKQAVVNVHPDASSVTLADGTNLSYDYLIVSPGLVYDLSLIEGLQEAIDKGVVCSNYLNPNYTWQCIQEFKGGTALFTQPNTPIKCGGAPQKIMYLAADYFRRTGLADKSRVIFATPGSVIFGVKVIAESLMQVIHKYGVDFRPFNDPVKIDADRKIAYFKNIRPKEDDASDSAAAEELIEVEFDLLHLAPPQVAPAFIKASGLANADGWMEVDINSMQHAKYPNIFGIGDAAALPTAKTGAAIRKQVPVMLDNIQKLMAGEEVDNYTYEGYSSCPLVTGYGKMVLAEFNYKNEFIPDPKLKQLLVFNSAKEHWRLWLLKKYLLPNLYWNKMMKGIEF